jgi:hypothetical protein
LNSEPNIPPSFPAARPDLFCSLLRININANITAANNAASGMPTPSPIFAPVERPLESPGVDPESELDLLVAEGVCVVDEDEDVESVLVVDDEGKSLSLYRTHIAGAGIVSPVNVNVLVNPSTSPSPVYATVVITVVSIVETQKVDEAPPCTAGVV